MRRASSGSICLLALLLAAWASNVQASPQPLSAAASPAQASASTASVAAPQPAASSTEKEKYCGEADGGTNTSPADDPRWIRITPLSSVWTGFTRCPDASFSNAYTRLIISSRHTRDSQTSNESWQKQVDEKAKSFPSEFGQDYGYIDRGPVARFFWGTHFALNLTAAISVGDFQATVPLMTIDHVSNRTDGERFTRIVAHTAQNFPLFLVKGDGSNDIASIKFVVKSTDSTDSSVASRSVQIASDLVKAVSPASVVLTSLNAQQTKDTASALDKAIDQVLSKQLDEEQWVENDIRRWHNGLGVTFKVPAAADQANWGIDDNKLQAVGQWFVSFEDPRPSVFSDIQVCPPWIRLAEKEKARAAAEAARPACKLTLNEAAIEAQNATLARPEQVLAFTVAASKSAQSTVYAYLKQADFWAATLTTLQSKTAPKADDVAVACRNIKNAIASLGLNNIDAGIVVAAVRDGIGLPAGTVAVMNQVPGCQYAVAAAAPPAVAAAAK